MLAEELDVGTVDTDGTSLALLDVLLAVEGSEAPLLRDDDLLATWELVLRATEGLDSGGAVCEFRSATGPMTFNPASILTRVTGADGEEDLADVDTGDSAVGLTEGTTHSGLQSIGTSARQHLVDAHDVVWVGADTHVETFLSCNLDHVPEAPVVSPSILSSSIFLPHSHLFVTYLFAQIRAASRASELNCSYSLETRWTQVGNSSTFARLRPRSKIRIFGLFSSSVPPE